MLLLLLGGLRFTGAFLPRTTTPPPGDVGRQTDAPRTPLPLTTLQAKKKKNANSKATTRGGGGFGTATDSRPAPPRDDYALFPALPADVLDTIVPAPLEWQTAGPLPPEVRDRLQQIYGFPAFNGASPDDDDAAVPSATTTTPLSLASLLMVTDEDTAEEEEEEEVNSTRQQLQQVMDLLPPFTDFRILHLDPLVLAVDNFLTADECQQYVALATANGDGAAAYTTGSSPTVGTTAAARAQRTSTTWYHSYERVPALLTKSCRLLGLDSGAAGWEEVQTVRYQRNQEFTWHLDALGPDALEEDSSAGQRIATLLVYLTDDVTGGATIFRDLNLQVQPKVGTALLFFPAAGGIPGAPTDWRTLHCGQAVAADSPQDKWIGQMWLRPRPYHVTVGTSHEDPVVAAAMAAYAATLDDPAVE
jgi:hypothetical protein